MHLPENLASIFKHVKMSLSSSSASTTPPIPTPDPDPDPNPIPPPSPPTSNLSCRIHNTELENTLSPPLSPSSRSPSLQPDLTATCEALVATETETGREGLTPLKGVPVYVMMPLESVTTGNEVNRKEAAEASLKALIHNTDLENTLIPHSQSPLLRPDLTATCEALVATETAAGRERLTPVKGVPVYVMMPLDSVTTGNEVNRKKAVDGSLKALKSAGVEGVMMDVWWGLVEREGPRVYNWGGYNELIGMAKEIGLKVQAVMSFHHCGGNVGDSCSIPLPKWVTEEIDRDPDLAYTDQWGRRSYEYISLGVDTLPVLKGRTPVQCYADFMDAFKNNFKHLLGDTVVEIQVGMGPAGELRYPSYPEQNGIWKFPGIGAFQCYDKCMLSSLKSAAEAAGEPEWGSSGPRDAGHYNNWPEDTRFFRRENGGWDSPYGKFFLSWYSQMLLDHGERVLSNAHSIFETTGVKISVKIAGIHWHYGGRSHPPELTAGYYNTRFHDGYIPIAQMLARYGAIFNFTCIEMRDHEQPQDARCLPEKLVRQVALATSKTGVPLAGENALPRYDETAYHQILNASSLKLDEIEQESKMCAFTYLRMNQDLFQPDNWRKFVEFVKKMKEVKQQVERDAEHSVHVTRPLVQEAAVAY